MFWVISVYFNIRNTLPKCGTFLLGHFMYVNSISRGTPKHVVWTPGWETLQYALEFCCDLIVVFNLTRTPKFSV